MLGKRSGLSNDVRFASSACFFLREYVRKKVHQDVKEELKEIGHSEDKNSVQ
jgi:hypothetical protein